MTDPIADMIVRIQNASLARKDSVLVPFSKLKWEIASVLEKEGFVGAIGKKGKKVAKFIEIALLYPEGNARIEGVKRISKPSRRIYMASKAIRPVRQGYGASILSTPLGIRTGASARKEKVGGEVLFELW